MFVIFKNDFKIKIIIIGFKFCKFIHIIFYILKMLIVIMIISGIWVVN